MTRHAYSLFSSSCFGFTYMLFHCESIQQHTSYSFLFSYTRFSANNFFDKTGRMVCPDEYRTNDTLDLSLEREEEKDALDSGFGCIDPSSLAIVRTNVNEDQESNGDTARYSNDSENAQDGDVLDKACGRAESMFLYEEYRTSGELDLEQEKNWEKDGLDNFFDFFGAGFDKKIEFDNLPPEPSIKEHENGDMGWLESFCTTVETFLCFHKTEETPQNMDIVIYHTMFYDKNKTNDAESDTESESDDSMTASKPQRKKRRRFKWKFWKSCKGDAAKQVVVFDEAGLQVPTQ